MLKNSCKRAWLSIRRETNPDKFLKIVSLSEEEGGRLIGFL